MNVPVMSTTRVGLLPWNYSCGWCRTSFLGVADTQRDADAWGDRHVAGCAIRALKEMSKKVKAKEEAKR